MRRTAPAVPCREAAALCPAAWGGVPAADECTYFPCMLFISRTSVIATSAYWGGSTRVKAALAKTDVILQDRRHPRSIWTASTPRFQIASPTKLGAGSRPGPSFTRFKFPTRSNLGREVESRTGSQSAILLAFCVCQHINAGGVFRLASSVGSRRTMMP